jgi:dihydroflavonol-4-reductase
VGRTLVTGATGLIGSWVARLLVERGDDVRLAVAHGARLDNLEDLDAQRVPCDVLDRRAVRRALRDVDRVFHCAGLSDMRATADDLYRVNVIGTRVVCEEALRAEVQRLVLTSSAAAVGPAVRGSTADETQPYRAGALGLPMVDSKHEAEVQALRVAAGGLPLVMVNPTWVFGRGDVDRSSTDIVRRFLARGIPAYVEGALNIVDVEDVARGHLLADEHGKVGERYLLGNRNFTMDRLFADLARLSGVDPPAIRLPVPAALALAETLGRLPGIPYITTDEIRAASQWWTYRSTKAHRELGWKPSHHEDTLVTTIAWYREREPTGLAAAGARQPLALRAAGRGIREVSGAVGRLVP